MLQVTQLDINYANCWLLIWDQILKKSLEKVDDFYITVWLQNFGHSIYTMYCEIYHVTKADFWGLPNFWFKCLQCMFDFTLKVIYIDSCQHCALKRTLFYDQNTIGSNQFFSWIVHDIYHRFENQICEKAKKLDNPYYHNGQYTIRSNHFFSWIVLDLYDM